MYNMDHRKIDVLIDILEIRVLELEDSPVIG